MRSFRKQPEEEQDKRTDVPTGSRGPSRAVDEAAGSGRGGERYRRRSPRYAGAYR